nr:ABC transporter ATP-binding protein [Kibdelosporangium sp. MJ126-NF4]CEL23271.1 Dipeptide transport ATP-binding protein DppD (TC 3.A.1.5.2) [Kibdelosporangium sp. MJ126-NF4]CTQ94433.1 Dipeptide transport ATP-binding protein DppD (TC 3.A.1.5.2) [Kibdelosporangium sp. MJ126-NF4]
MLSYDHLSITFGDVEATRSVSFEVRPGEVVAVVGESGSGKSVTAMSALGLLPRKAKVTGKIMLGGRDVGGLTGKQLRELRGNEIAMVFQEPMTALNPVHTIGWQLTEAITLHKDDVPDVKRKAVELLTMVGLDRPEQRLKQYPHELSGGMRQRVMIAMAIACDPKVIIADEPTTALDVTVQAEILDLLRNLRDRLGTAIVLITHSMGVVADLADRVVVMYRGAVVETGGVEDVLLRPAHDYTKRLLKAVPRLGSGTRQVDESAKPVLSVRNLVVSFGGQRAVDDISFHVAEGEVLGLVGESGSGKTTAGRCTVGLQKPTQGSIELFGQDIAKLSARGMRPLTARIGMIFQDPASSLDPRMTVAECVAEPLVLHRAKDQRERVDELLDSVELGAAVRDRYTHELSGGQRQRVSIARAIALDPDLLIADEPTSALDVSVQASILELFLDLQRRLKFSCLFISHDLAVVDMLANRVAVMHRGKIVEQGSRADVFGAPQEDYTRGLLAAAPVPDPVEQRERRASRG